MTIKSYSELIMFNTFAERYDYLRIKSFIGDETFGSLRCLNQTLYTSQEWKKFRRQIIIRDNGCDLGMEDHPFGNKEIIVIHHLNPLTKSQILSKDKIIFDPENVISCRHSTHMAIHYGSINNIDIRLIERKVNDTCPWRH